MEIIISKEHVGYPYALEFMDERVAGIIDNTKKECLWLLEHPALYTYGTSAKQADLLENKFPVYEARRGGEFTYHGPGQRVAYLMMKLEPKDIRKYVWNLEEWIIQILAHFGVNGERREGRIGIWVIDGGQEKKIAALGIRVRKWVAYHGIAINIAPDLEHFKGIVPCGISQYGVTSLQNLGIEVNQAEFDEVLIREFNKIFNAP
ncbi:MAG: lipoate-protein ligase B [Alphaproteobacteria bacterium CG11_big_fil_rev_8_21_14_0_20_44_7]|nr:MAG: lipoate-protein ligase B [Alphaproteobacteria bacterium CG11_big_fil_rev_8_21_14_0_20_44_7]